MAKEQETKVAKPKKKRTKRNIVVFEYTLEGQEGRYRVLKSSFLTSAEATKWIRENGADLVGKTICIANMTPSRKVKIETKSVVKF